MSKYPGCGRESKSSPDRSYRPSQAIVQARARKLARSHRRIFLDRRKDIMLTEVGEERSLPSERRHLRKSFKAEVSPLELALAQVAPFGKGDGLAVTHAHRQRITMHEILRQ